MKKSFLYLLTMCLAVAGFFLGSVGYAQTTGDTGTGSVATGDDTSTTGDDSMSGSTTTGDDSSTGSDSSDDTGAGSCVLDDKDMERVAKFKTIVDSRLAKHPWKAEFWQFRMTHLLNVLPEYSRVWCIVDEVHSHLLEAALADEDMEQSQGILLQRFKNMLMGKGKKFHDDDSDDDSASDDVRESDDEVFCRGEWRRPEQCAKTVGDAMKLKNKGKNKSNDDSDDSSASSEQAQDDDSDDDSSDDDSDDDSN